MRWFRALIIVLGVILGLGISYAVFYPTLGIRQNLAEEEFQKAWLLYQDRKYDAAIEKLSAALLINPQFHWARRFLAQAYYLSGQTSEALQEYEALYRAMPHDLTLKNHLDFLSKAGEGSGPERIEFLRVVPRVQGYRYNRPTFIGSIHSDQLAVLSLGNFEIGNMVSYSAQGEPYENRHRVSGKLNYPMAFAQNDEEIWITDFKEDRIHRLNKNSRRYFSYFFNPKALGTSGAGELMFSAPAGICHREGEFIIADSGNNRLQRVSDSGRYIASITRPAEGDPMQTPFGIYCDADSVWVTESGAARISHLDRYGNLVAEYSPKEIKKPRHISWDEDQKLFAVADESAGILFMDKSGMIQKKISGYNTPAGRLVSFARPYSAAFDAFRNFYVADYGSSEVVQFAPQAEKFGQLYLQVEKISAAKFPQVGVYVSVSAAPVGKNATGLPEYLTELKPGDFKIFENDAPVGNLGAEYLRQFDDVLQGVILVARSRRLAELEPQIPWVLDHLLTKIREKDRFKVMSHGSDVRHETEFVVSRLRLLQAVKGSLADSMVQESTQPTQSPALYDAISELVNREGKRTLLYLTDGEADDDKLTPYEKDRILDYARANHISVFILSLEHADLKDSDGKDALMELAQKTGGAYYRALEVDTKIEARMRAQKEVRYVLSYQSLAKKEMRGQYIDIRVLARFRQKRGLDLSGYFIP